MSATFRSQHAVWLIAKREIATRVRSKSFVWSTIAILLVIAGYIGLMQYTSSGADEQHVAFAPNAQSLVAPFEEVSKAAGAKPITTVAFDSAQARTAVEEGDIDAYVTKDGARTTVVVENDATTTVAALLSSVVQQQAANEAVQRAGVGQQLQASVAAAGPTVETTTVKDPLEDQRMYLSYAIAMLLYFALLIFGLGVAQGVVEEKSSRVVELLLSTYRPWQVLAGKILGIGLVGLLQLSIIAAAGVAGAQATDLLNFDGELLNTVVMSLVWFILGFLFFSTMLAAAGSLVSRQEELNSVTQPVIFLIAVPFILSLTLLQSDRDGLLVQVLSMVPPFAPVLMPQRIALTDAAVWEVGVAVVLTLAATGALIWLAGRIYANAVLRTGARVSLKSALRAG